MYLMADELSISRRPWFSGNRRDKMIQVFDKDLGKS
jgi:hypothetical protein